MSVGRKSTGMRPGASWLLSLNNAREAQRVAAAYREHLGGENAAARRILVDLARYCRVGQSSFVAGDPHQTAFNEGARDVFLHVTELCGLKPEDFRSYFNEAEDDR
jgi:hypothetical protein